MEMECEEVELPNSSHVKTDFIVNSDGSITVDEITIPPAPQPALTVEATKERLIITELIVRDFKSYAGTHTIGPFNKNFSCIVGPNGSGKSNVIDSLLFVFGYRAQKIRSKKVSVLIHKSHKFPNLESCSVQVNFSMIKEEGKDYTVIPKSEFSIKRTGCIDNSSSYEINGKRAQYKDVATLLRSYGIDLDYNRFMILQGEIELISMMKPKAPTEQDSGMLEYIEDIIGTNRFIKPIQHFNAKVEKMNELRLEKLNQLKIIEKERADIEKIRNKALDYLRLSNKAVLMKNSVLQAQMHSKQEEERLLIDSKNLLLEKIERASTGMEELKACKEVKDSEMKNLMIDYDKCAKTVEELKEQYSDLERQDAACRENIKNSKEKLKKMSKSLETEEAKIISLKKKHTTLEGEIKELEVKKQKVEAEKAIEEEKLNEAMGSVKEEIEGFQEEKDVFESQLVKLKSIVDEKKSELDLTESELELVLSTEKKEKEALESLQSEHEKTASLLEEQKKTLKEAKEKLPELEKELVSSRTKLAETERKEESVLEEIKVKRIKVDEMKNSLSASQSRSTLVRAFMEQKAKGKLSGVLGRLGDLGAIDEKYDVAISTACGPLDHIVTDTIVTAQQCVEFLKANNLGYATFIALDKMEKWIPYTKEKITTPENVPRLFDLVKVKNEAVLPAFYFALRNTLVAKDLEQATRVGLQGSTRYRVVTLKGELIDLSGTMSGGGGRTFKGRMGQSVTVDNKASEKDIEQLNIDLGRLANDAADARKCKQELKERISSIEKEIPQLQHSMKKAKHNYDAYVESLKMLASQMEEQKKRIKAAAPDQNKIKELESKISEKNKSFTKATKDASVIEEKIKCLQDKIMAVTKGKIGAVQKRVDKLTKELDTVTNAMVKSKTMIKKSLKDISKAEEKVTTLQKDIKDCQNAKEDLAKKFDELGKKGIETVEKKNEAMKELEVFEAKKRELSKDVKEVSDKVHQIKSELIELKNKVKTLEMDIKVKNSHGLSFKAELQKLEMYEIDDESSELPTLSPDEIAEVNINALYVEIGRFEEQMKGMNPDLGAVAEFKKKDLMLKQKQKDLEETVAERDHYKMHYERLRKCRTDEFMKGFTIVSLKVKELYQMITLGGDAELELVDSMDPFSEGIEFSVRPLRKSWKNIRNLSGGEKTLSSLSLVFALHYYRSTPFFVMDEIDAALDFRNVSIISHYIKESTKNAQFIVISLRENMFQLADHLVGIYKTNNRTKNVALGPALLSMFEKLEQSFRSSKGKKEDSKKEDLTKPGSHDAKEDKEDCQNTLQSSLNKSQKSADEADNSLKKSVTFDLSPSENKENLITSRSSNKSEDVFEDGKKSVTFDLSPSENKENLIISSNSNKLEEVFVDGKKSVTFDLSLSENKESLITSQGSSKLNDVFEDATAESA